MGKFSLKKKDDGDEDSSRLALFGGRSKSRSPAPPSQNPYAQASLPPDPYTRAKMNAGVYSSSNGPAPGPALGPGAGPGRPGYQPAPPPNGGPGGMRPPGPQQGGYGRDNGRGPSSNGYAPDQKFGASPGAPTGAGYGADKFGGHNPYGPEKSAGNPYAGAASRSGPGGYGGLGRTTSDETETDANREALFGGARERLQQRAPASAPPGYEYNPESGQEQRSYGAYGDRQLTAEEEAEEDVSATKQEIKFIKQQDVSSTRNALQMATMAEETGRNTLARLGAQGERIHNTERNLDVAENQNRIAEDRIKELNKLNRSMFIPVTGNPFTSRTRRERHEAEILERHQAERAQREATREAAFQSTQRMNQNFKGLEQVPSSAPKSQASLAERGKYQFEADSEDDAMENEIEENIEQLGAAAGRLNLLAKATGEEIEAQNAHLLTIAAKSDRFDDRLHTNTERLKRRYG